MTEAAELPLVQYWHSNPVPGYIAELFQTFADLNPDLAHRVFTAAEAEAFIAEHFSGREVAAFSACAVPAMQADYFRYCAVLRLGGVYSDADFLCVAGLRPLLPPAGEGHLFRGPRGNVINGIFTFGSHGHSFLRLALDIATANIERRLCDQVYFTTGPPIFMTLVGLHGRGSFDALIRAAVGTKFEPFVRPYCEAIGDCDRIGAAFDGIEISAPRAYEEFVRLPNTSLPYKSSDTHWVRYKGGIFR